MPINTHFLSWENYSIFRIVLSTKKQKKGRQNSEIVTTPRDEIKKKLREHFDGKIVRKDLTKKIKQMKYLNKRNMRKQ